MPVTVTMPDLGDSVTEATISRWLHSEGDHVEEGQPLLEVSTDKVDSEIPAPASGTLTIVQAAEGDIHPVGAVLASIDESSRPLRSLVDPPISETPVAPLPETRDEAVPTVPDTPPEQPVAAGDTSSSTPYVTPLVRRLAVELNVDLADLAGSGVGGRIRKVDVLAAAEARQIRPQSQRPADLPVNPYISPLVKFETAQRGLDIATITGSGRNGRVRFRDLTGTAAGPPRGDRTEKLSRLRTVIARRMVDSLQTAAQLTSVVEVDMTEIALLRREFADSFTAATGTKLTFTSFFIAAAVQALADFPALNASIDTDAGTATYFGNIDLNIAVDTERGLVAPVVKRADSLGLAAISRLTSELADKARSNTLTANDMTVGTFTLTNTGSRGALFDTPIINQPQVAILGTGAVTPRAVVVVDDDGQHNIEIRSAAYLALTYDHRLVDGADAARFLSVVKARLEKPRYEQELRTTVVGRPTMSRTT